jgi:hypothetical protein
MPEPDPKLDHLLRTAIEQTRLLRLRYRNKDRIVEPQMTMVSTTASSNC